MLPHAWHMDDTEDMLNIFLLHGEGEKKDHVHYWWALSLGRAPLPTAPDVLTSSAIHHSLW